MRRLALATGMFLAMSAPGIAQEVSVPMRSITATSAGSPSDDLGEVTFSASGAGINMNTDLRGLPPGPHGFHIHERGDCGPGPNDSGETVAGGAAGGHWDPEGSDQHLGPEGAGHRGDAPRLEVAQDGTANVSLNLSRIESVSDLSGKALIIHEGGDNYSDQPTTLGGGGGRIACGVIP